MRLMHLIPSFSAVLLTLAAAACSESAPSRPPLGSPGSGGAQNPTSGNGGINVGPQPQAGMPGGITVPTPGEGPGEGSCQQAEVNFEPKIPTVFVLVDRSGSMFRDEPKPWEPLKAAVLDVMEELQAEIRFGFGAFTGEVGDMCPMFDRVNADLNNFSPIQTLYNGLMPPVKGETPTMRVLATVRETLAADTTDGPKYILFVTDGEPDYCGDGNPLCPVDGVVYQLQQLHAEGIQTFVFGIQTSETAVPESTLQAWANAGAGQPVGYLDRSGTPIAPIDIFNQCFHGGDTNAAGWKEDYATSGRPMNEPLGMYGATGGNAPVFKPDPGDQTALAQQIRRVVSNVKSCTFDLQGQIEVDLGRAGEGSVRIDGSSVPFEATNGWRMLTTTQLQLEGTACQTWRDTGTNIKFDFPCEIIVVR